jgi:hypothetical protein
VGILSAELKQPTKSLQKLVVLVVFSCEPVTFPPACTRFSVDVVDPLLLENVVAPTPEALKTQTPLTSEWDPFSGPVVLPHDSHPKSPAQLAISQAAVLNRTLRGPLPLLGEILEFHRILAFENLFIFVSPTCSESGRTKGSAKAIQPVKPPRACRRISWSRQVAKRDRENRWGGAPIAELE